MNEQIGVSSGYVSAQWAKALRATDDADPAVRKRAAERVRRWERVISGMADGTLAIGRRTPVKGLPSWVTLQVVHGGFATGQALAESPLDEQETALAARIGVPAQRAALFEHYLTDEGLDELRALLRSGHYRLETPESAALPVLAWLLDHGHDDAATELVDKIIPFAPRLRFTPVPHETAPVDPSLVYRETAGQARNTLAQRPANQRVATMREALSVWNPFGDEVLSWWLESVGPVGEGGEDGGRPGEVVTAAWLERGRALAERHRALAAEHTLCTKHRNPKENLAILLSCLATIVAGNELDARRRGLLRHAVESMVRRRGTPGESRHSALRQKQAAQAALPMHTEIAAVVTDRLDALPQGVGIAGVDDVVTPVDLTEAAAHPQVPAGTVVPAALVRVVRRATAARVEQLVELGLISSCEELAALLPQLTARTFAAAFPDPDLSALMAELYRVFRARRSLLLLNLEHQVRIGELPWVAALAAVRTGSAGTEAGETLRELGTLTLRGFPATQLPNRLITELSSLCASAGLGLPWVEELAADIFMGVFTPKFHRAAKIAGGLLVGSLYERYYGIDYAAVLALDPDTDTSAKPEKRVHNSLPSGFDKLCAARADRAGRTGRSVAANGMVIEQSLILTTHNLATLVGPCDVHAADGWQVLADSAFTHMLRLGRRLTQAKRPLPVIKDLAYAWRHTVFYLSMPGADAQTFLDTARQRLSEAGSALDAMLTPVIDGLDAIARGESFDAEGRAGDGWQLLGWSTGGHWMRSRRA